MPETVLKGPVNLQRRRPSLVLIATHLNIPGFQTAQIAKANKKQILQKVNSFISENQELVGSSPDLQGLITYRAESLGTGRDTSKEKGKTSADKADEDRAEAAKPLAPTTGAPKKLLQAGFTTDPPAQFTPLKKGAIETVKPAPYRATTPEDSDLSSVQSNTKNHTALTEQDEKLPAISDSEILPVGAPQTPSRADEYNNHGKIHSKSVVVRFRDYDNRDAAAEEVWVTGAKSLSIEEQTQDGQITYSTKLSKLLPAAIQQSTPIRKSGGRVYRDSITTAGSRVNLGSIESFVSGDLTSTLKFEKIDSYKLLPAQEDEDILTCEVFLRSDNNKASSTTSPAIIKQGPAAPVSERAIKTSKPSKTSLDMLDNSDEDVLVPKAQPVQNAAKNLKGVERFLHKLLNGPQVPWKRAEHAIDVLERHKVVLNAIEQLRKLGWSRSTGGFQIPDDYAAAGKLAGTTFTKEHVYKALLLKHSQASSDALLFKPDVMLKLPDLEEWFKDPNGRLARVFRSMSKAKFAEWQDNAVKNLTVTVKGKNKELKHQGGKKRTRHENESESETRRSKKARAANSAKRSSSPVYPHDSEHLDESSSSDEDSN